MTTLRKNSSKNIDGLVTSMCGYTSGLVLLNLAEGDKNLVFKRVDYCNSGDSPYGDKEGVVGYHAIALVERSNNPDLSGESSGSISFSPGKAMNCSELQETASNQFSVITKDYLLMKLRSTAPLKKPIGAFVTIKIDGALRDASTFCIIRTSLRSG
jgi:hypothetical protein